MKKHRSHTERRINNKYKYGEQSFSPSGKFFFFCVYVIFMFHMFNTNGISLSDRQCIWLSDAWNSHCNSKYIHICSENGLRSRKEMGHFSPALQFSEWITSCWPKIYQINCDEINSNQFYYANK